MREYSPFRLADLIIHELVHSTVFIKGQVSFNEELAEFIGSEGARLYIETRYGITSREYLEITESETNSRNFIAFVQGLIGELEILYSGDLGREEKLAEKEKIINSAKEKFDAEYESRFSNDNYRGFSEMQINNAYLELFRIYYTEDNFYTDLYECSGRALPAFVTAANTIKKKGNPREQLERALMGNGK
jgi:predicted aminopeptidase